MLDTASIRKDFPLYARTERADFAYLDSASSSQTPSQVLEAMENYYKNFRANVHRGMYRESELATNAYEDVRRKAADFIRAKEDEIVFTRGTTESLNIVARGLCKNLKAGDEVVLTGMEHHANLVPWQQLAIEKGFAVKHIPVRADYTLDMAAAASLIGPQTKVVAMTYASNVLGTIVPVAELATLAKKHDATVVVDAAQAAGHIQLDVTKIDCDFLAFSGHKMLGPTGVGVLWGKKQLLDAMDPLLYGGDMIREVTWEKSTWNETPWKFEAGTPNVAGVIGLGAAIDYVRLTGQDKIAKHEHALAAYAIQKLSVIPGVKIIGPGADTERVAVVSFEVAGVHPHDIATILDAEKVCIRAGSHCAMPLLQDLGIMDGTARASFGITNDMADVDRLVAGIEKAKKIFQIV